MGISISWKVKCCKGKRYGNPNPCDLSESVETPENIAARYTEKNFDQKRNTEKRLLKMLVRHWRFRGAFMEDCCCQLISPLLFIFLNDKHGSGGKISFKSREGMVAVIGRIFFSWGSPFNLYDW